MPIAARVAEWIDHQRAALRARHNRRVAQRQLAALPGHLRKDVTALPDYIPSRKKIDPINIIRLIDGTHHA